MKSANRHTIHAESKSRSRSRHQAESTIHASDQSTPPNPNPLSQLSGSQNESAQAESKYMNLRSIHATEYLPHPVFGLRSAALTSLSLLYPQKEFSECNWMKR